MVYYWVFSHFLNVRNVSLIINFYIILFYLDSSVCRSQPVGKGPVHCNYENRCFWEVGIFLHGFLTSCTFLENCAGLVREESRQEFHLPPSRWYVLNMFCPIQVQITLLNGSFPIIKALHSTSFVAIQTLWDLLGWNLSFNGASAASGARSSPSPSCPGLHLDHTAGLGPLGPGTAWGWGAALRTRDPVDAGTSFSPEKEWGTNALTKHGCNVKILCYGGKVASHKGSHTVGFHLQGTSGIGKSRETDRTSAVARGWVEREWERLLHEDGVSMWSDEKFWN